MDKQLLPEYVRNIINKTPTGSHYDLQWWTSRYTDLQNDRRMKGLTIELDFSMEDLFNEVLRYYKDNELALLLLKRDFKL